METYLTFNKYEKYNLTIFTILIFVFIFMYVSFHCFYKSPLVWKTFIESTNHRRQDIAVLILNVKCCNLISRSENCLSLQNRQLIWYLIKSHFYSSCKMYKLSVWEAYKNGYFQMLMGGQHVVRVFQISQVVVQWSKESESTVRAESIFLSTIIFLQSAIGWPAVN